MLSNGIGNYSKYFNYWVRMDPFEMVLILWENGEICIRTYKLWFHTEQRNRDSTYPVNAWRHYSQSRRILLASVSQIKDTVSVRCWRVVSGALFGHHYYKWPDLINADDNRKVRNSDQLLRFSTHQGNVRPWINIGCYFLRGTMRAVLNLVNCRNVRW